MNCEKSIIDVGRLAPGPPELWCPVFLGCHRDQSARCGLVMFFGKWTIQPKVSIWQTKITAYKTTVSTFVPGKLRLESVTSTKTTLIWLTIPRC